MPDDKQMTKAAMNLFQTLTLTFTGHLPPGSFAEFARHRAARLSLGLDIVRQSGDTAVMMVSGPPDLVDAFEMALSLGPHGCLVRDVLRSDTVLAA